MKYGWSTAKYIDEVENGPNPGLQQYQRDELNFVKSVDDLANKAVIDVGAGYGRVLPKLAPLAKGFIAVEQDTDELEELNRRAAEYPNSKVIAGSGDELIKLLPDVARPLILSLQNTLGPWDGNRDLALEQKAAVAKQGRGEIIISLFCRESIKDWGLPMYATVSGLLGNYSSSISDIDNGIYKTDTGYESYWFSSAEREAMKVKLGGKLVREIKDHKFHIFQISYAS